MWTRAMSVVGALTVAVTLTGCNGSAAGSSSGTSAADSETADAKTVYRLGEASPPKETHMRRSKGGTFTVTPTEVRTGTEADVANSGVQLDKSDGAQVPVYVSVTLTHTTGKVIPVGDMDDDLVVRTDGGQRTKALLVLLGQATWPDCPAPDTDKQLSKGQSADICTVFLIPASQQAAAVELTQGYYKPPLQWPVDSEPSQ